MWIAASMQTVNSGDKAGAVPRPRGHTRFPQATGGFFSPGEETGSESEARV